MRVVVQEAPFNPGDLLNSFAKGDTDIGAVVSFTGVTRDVSGGLSRMQIEHYPGMTERALTQICEEAQKRWTLADVMVIHRFGMMEAGDNIMMVATASRHRADAFAAADFLMDYLKSRAPFWKKEVTADGADWVEAKESDEDALDRWS